MQQTNYINMITQINKNHNRSTALERSVIKHWGPKLVLRTGNLALGSAVYKHTHCLVRVKNFFLSMHQNSKHINQDLTLR